MAEANVKQTKKKSGAVVIGFVVILLVAVGLFTVIRAAVEAISGLNSNDEQIEQYEKYLSPVIMNDPDTFDDVTQANMDQLISISMWTLLESDELSPDKYEYVDEGMLIPKADVDASFISLFGSDVAPVHTTVDGGEGVEFIYDETREAYIVPITSITAVYTPDVISIDKKGTTVILTVGYLTSTDWMQDKDGKMVPPVPAKYMRVTLRDDMAGSFYISAIQPALAADYVTEKATETITVEDESASETAAALGTSSAADAVG